MVAYSRAALTIGLVVLLVTGPVGAVATGQSPGIASNGMQEDDSSGSADDVYVEDDGDAVLVYRNNESDSTANGHFGADLSEGLFHVFLNDTIEDQPENDFTGNASFVLGPESMSGDGAFSMTKPETLEDLTVDASVTQTREESSGSVALDATVLDESGQSSSSFESVSTEGSMTTTSSQFSTEGSATATLSEEQSLPSSSQMNHEFTLQETDEAYVLTAAQDYAVGIRDVDNWSTRANATRTLESEFETTARGLDGDASVTVDSYSFDAETNRLDIEYTVEFTGVDEAVSEQLTASLASSQDLDLSESEARDLADRIQSVELTELSGSVDVQARQASTNWNVQIDNYDEAAAATFDILEATEMNASQADLEESRSQFEAMQAADLQQTMNWNGSLSVQSDDTVTMQFDAEYATENWQAYVSELEDRDVEWPGDTTFETHVETEDDELTATASATFSQEGLVENAIDGMLQEADTTSGPGEDNEQARAFLQSFQRSEFERAKMDVSATENTVTVEAATSFDNVSAFRDVMNEAYGDDLAVTSAFGESQDGETVTYLRVANAVDSDANESDVRALSPVGDDTEVHMPDDWDQSERTFPEMNTTEANTFLGLDDDGGDDDSEDDDASSSSLPGFGPAVALVALVAFALFAGRRSA